MKYSCIQSFVLVCTAMLSLSASARLCLAEVYELRTYVTMEDKLDDLNARFRDHTVAFLRSTVSSLLATGCRRMAPSPRTL